MKLFLTLGLTCGVVSLTLGQSLPKRIVINTKNKTESRVETRADETVEKAFTAIEGGVSNIFKKKEKGENENATQDPESGSIENSQSIQPGDLASPSHGNSLQSFSNFDFIPGEKVIAYEDFSQDAVGDFPARWNTNSSGEVVTLEGIEGKWLLFKDEGVVFPEFVGSLPENCTIEFEMGSLASSAVLTKLLFLDEASNSNLLNYDLANGIEMDFDPNTGNTTVNAYDGSNANLLTNTKPQKHFFIPEGGDYSFVKVSIWKQKSRLRVYLNETKVWDLPKAFASESQYRFALATNTFFIEGRELLLTNLRFAVGQPDTRSKLITEGKFITQGIVFDSGSATIKPESYAVLKEIATVLEENGSIQVEIVGHTDSDGDENLNLTLSQRRAEAVKKALSDQFGIDGGRLSTNGKGESEPIAPNSNSDGKAQNRRVEFIKK